MFEDKVQQGFGEGFFEGEKMQSFAGTRDCGGNSSDGLHVLRGTGRQEGSY
jgi:hypothetical protein